MLKKFLLLSAFIPSIAFAASPVTVTDPGGINAQTVNAAGAANVNLTNVNGATANIAQETGGNLATTATKLSAIGTSSINIQGSSANGAADDGSNPLKVGGLYLVTPPSYTNSQRSTLQTTMFGDLYINPPNTVSYTAVAGIPVAFRTATSNTGRLLATLGYIFNGSGADSAMSINGQVAAAGGAGGGFGLAMEEAGESFANITTATTTVVKSGPGVLHKVCENTIAASASISMFNNTAGSGASIGVITNPLTLLQMGPLCAVYDVYFSTGLTIVTTGVQNITVTFR